MKPRLWVAALLVAGLSSSGVGRQTDARSLDVYWIDVEGGAATLIVTPAGESVLIDTGYPDERGAPRIHKVATEVAGLTRIDHLVTTHFHIDHFGGAIQLAKLMPVGRVYDNGAPSPGPSEKDAPFLAAYTATFEGRRRMLQPGDTIPLTQAPRTERISLRLIGTREQFVHPTPSATPNDAECARVAQKPADTTDNRNSTVWFLERGPFGFFHGGDLTWNTEARLVCPVNLVGPVDVYQVDHHGLDVSNNPVLLRSLAPTVTVMNNGPRKGTQPQTMATLRTVASIQAMYQVHKNVREGKEDNTGDDFIANVPEQCGAHYIKMSVEPSGKRYTIAIPGTGHSRTFATRP